jgi:hypothetical protein
MLNLFQEIGERWQIGYALCMLSWVALAKEAYPKAYKLAQESVAVYRQIGRKGYVVDALATLGVAARGLGRLSQSRQHLHEALKVAAKAGGLGPLMWVLPALSLLLADRGEAELAVEIYALVSRYPLVTNSRWCEDVFGRHIAAVAATLPPDVVAAAQERGRARDLWSTVEELLSKLEEQLGADPS